MTEVEEYILSVKKRLMRDDVPTEKVLKYLRNLRKLPVTIDLLKTTGIGKTVNGLKKSSGEVGEAASELITKWRQNVSSENHTNKEQAKTHHPTEKESGESSVSTSSSKHEKSKADDRQSREFPAVNKHKKEKKPEVNPFFANGLDVKKKTSKSTKAPLKLEKGKPSLPDIVLPELPKIELPDIEPVYRPLLRLPELQPNSQPTQDSENKKKKTANFSNIDLGANITSRKSRTQVFSGRKAAQHCGVVLSLYQMCMKILIENIDALEDTGGVPFDILEPVLAKCTPDQLMFLEECNPYFTEDSGELWKIHCQREFKGCEPDDMESWREMFMRKRDERAIKLQKINEKITALQATKKPERQVKLAYVSMAPKASPQVQRKQIKYGTGKKKELPKASQRIREASPDPSLEHVPFTRIPKRERCKKEMSSRPRPVRSDEDLGSMPSPAKKSKSKPMMKAALKLFNKQRGRVTSQVIRR